MTGTRLALISVYVCQSFFLTILALYLGNKLDNNSGTNNGQNDEEPLFVNRRGIHLLHPHLSNTLEELNERVESLVFKVCFRVALIGDEDFVTHKWMVESLSSGLKNYLSSPNSALQVQHNSIDAQVVASMIGSESKTWTGIAGDDARARFVARFDQERITESENGYDLLVGVGCTESMSPRHNAKLDVSDSGDMFLCIREGVAEEEIRIIFRDDVSKFLVDDFLSPLNVIDSSPVEPLTSPTGNPSLLEFISSLDMTLTLMDENPASYSNEHNANRAKNNSSGTIVSSSFSAREHHELLIQAVSSTMEKSINPMLIERLSYLFDDINLGRNVMPYRGRSFSSKAMVAEREYVVDAKEVKDSFLTKDIAPLTKERSSWTTATKASSMDNFPMNWNLVLFIPPKNILPLKIRGNGSTSLGTAFTFPDSFTAVSIVNLIGGNNGEGNDTRDKFSDSITFSQQSYYRDVVASSLFYFGTFIRQNIGLRAQQPHRISPSTINKSNSSLILNHLSSPYGMTHWEVHALQRTLWKGKARHVLSRLKNILSLIEWKHSIAFPVQSAENINDCVGHLLNALDLATKYEQEIQQSIHAINSAQRMANALSYDGEMVDLSYFSLEQLFAVFGSLLVPLILPFLLGLGRELKRYRKLLNKDKL